MTFDCISIEVSWDRLNNNSLEIVFECDITIGDNEKFTGKVTYSKGTLFL